MLLGNKIKELRDKHEVLQRQLAAYLEIDTPMFSKKDYATGLSFVLSDPSASRRFFMLNGVETKSPSGNIVVVKSGTKVRKMVVR